LCADYLIAVLEAGKQAAIQTQLLSLFYFFKKGENVQVKGKGNEEKKG